MRQPPQIGIPVGRSLLFSAVRVTQLSLSPPPSRCCRFDARHFRVGPTRFAALAAGRSSSALASRLVVGGSSPSLRASVGFVRCGAVSRVALPVVWLPGRARRFWGRGPSWPCAPRALRSAARRWCARLGLLALPVALLVVVAGVVASRLVGWRRGWCSGVPRVAGSASPRFVGLALCRWPSRLPALRGGTAALPSFAAARRAPAPRFLALGVPPAAGCGQVSRQRRRRIRRHEGGGARTPLSGAIAAAFVLVVGFSFRTAVCVPQPVLAAVC